MPLHTNLISDSLLITETIALLQSYGGRASVVEVVDAVMQISQPEPRLAKLLISDLIETDPRLHLKDETVEFVPLDLDSRKLFETDFVVFDLETTGAKTPPCRVTEIGAYRVESGEIVSEFQTLVNPESFIPPFISGLTGISNEMVRDAPKFREVATDFLEFIGDAVLVAHNAQFDMHFLNHEIGRVYDGYRVANSHLCTVRLSRKLLPQIANHRLDTVADYFSINIENRHRAADDAHATAKIFVYLMNQLQGLGIENLGSIKKLRI